MGDTLSTELAGSGERTFFQVASVIARLFVYLPASWGKLVAKPWRKS
jgi:hypothetical protein